ncbi:hypothetical protein GCM10011529_16680 [Polymorphobacter glacialis]|uniref:BrnA antitoxin family protein n=1 Tax=Sandarakinorhabdus glacialis TaxID=1614636 RepID=A0A916ZRT9_9SPHN|nr:BrnA antitoxin family protein [Polymorphobacter glacialis]GGE10970.1 hypothetical protein GCM10011529_16680 [Polymorphobacter glacialis]
MPRKKPDTETPWIDPDDAPELDEHFFETGRISRGDTVLREATDTFAKRGRPKSDDPKQLVSLRLDRVVLERLRAQGPGWQSRVNDLLRKEVGA